MSRRAGAWTDEFELLCEQCGYSIEGLPRDALCPECSFPIDRSQPDHRSGTPFQRRPHADALLPTIRLMLLEPGTVWATARPVWWESWRLHVWLLSLTSLAAGIGLTGLLVDFDVNRRRLELMLLVITGCLAAVPVFVVVFLALRAVELGLAQFSAPARKRMDRAVAVTILSHASSALFASASVLAGAGLAASVANLSSPRCWVVAAVVAILGLCWFGLLVVWGARELRYANRLREWTESPEEAG